MCGIAGFLGRYDPTLLEDMNNVQEHRGPDDAGVWFDPVQGVGFAHRRLSIIDLSTAGHQPMIDEDGPGIITYNGEIYNYRELRKELLTEGFTFRSDTDTEVLLKLYQRDGFEMLSVINGIFAFAIWDRQKRALFLARDALGVKPLYYAITNRGLLFASELKAIIQESTVSKEIDLEAIQNYMIYLWCPAPKSPFRNIYKFEPGQAMVLSERKINRKWYFYDLPYSAIESQISFEDAVSVLKERIEVAVMRQLVSDVPVGSFLSGGLDSSAVVSIARKYQQNVNFQCFTINSEASGEGFVDDLPYAKETAEYLNVDLQVINVGSDITKKLPFMIYHLEEPQSDPAPLHVFSISKLAREHGTKVLLSGVGGDDIFAGYRRHYALMLEHLWAWLPYGLRKWLKAASGSMYQKNPFSRRVSKALRYADLGDEDRLISYFYWIDPKIVKDLFCEDAKAILNGTDPIEPLRKTLSRLPKDINPLNKMLYLEAKHFLSDHNLNYTDKMSMAVGVEVRVPLLDVDLISFATSLPSNFKQKGCEGKWVFKKSMEDILPRRVIYRPKSGFGSPLRKWLHNDLVSFTDKILGRESLSNRGIFNPCAIQDLISADRAGRIDAAYTIFSLMCFEIWCRLFIDGQHYDSFEI
jgi:asparagine synthase (glutamine-hydrolysing)